MKSLNINIGDTVVALGSTISKDGIINCHKELAEVIAVGKQDIFAKTIGGGRVFKIPSSRCILVADKECELSVETLHPKIGNLVFSFVERFSKIEKKMGVLIEIIDAPGRMKMATLLQGEKKETVSYSSLIVLE